MKEVIVKMTNDRVKVKHGEYVQDLVRCKDCKRITAVAVDEGTCLYWCNFIDKATDEWRYCSYGEVRDEQMD